MPIADGEPGGGQPGRRRVRRLPGRWIVSRSSLNRLAGASSAWAGAITGGFVLLALPFTPLLEDLPDAVLGAVVVGAVVKLVAVGDLWHLVRTNRVQALVGVGTFVATVASAPRVERAVMVGVALALGAHLARELRVTTPGTRDGDVLTVAPEGVLWFATVPSVERLIRRELAEHADIDLVVLDLAGVGRLDGGIRRITEEIGRPGEVEIVNIRQGASAALHFGD